MAEQRWGKYISEVELSLILQAHEVAGQPTTALEIGAEGGRWAKILADLGWDMICTDIVPEVLEVCQKRIPNAKCVLVDRDSITFPCETESARLLLAIEVHELVEQDWFIDEACRVLESGGLFVGVFQNTRSWRALIRNLKRDPPGSITHYTASYAPWRRKLSKRGIRMIREVGLCWMPFGRKSDSRLIPPAVTVERMLGLRKLPSLSPWVVFVAQKDFV